MEAVRKPQKKCVVPGCSDLFSKRHTFPMYDLLLFDKWIAQIHNPALIAKTREQIYRSYVICDIHFSEEEKVPGTKRGLKRNSFPTQYLRLEGNEESTASVNSVKPSIEPHYLATGISSKVLQLLSSKTSFIESSQDVTEIVDLGELCVSPTSPQPEMSSDSSQVVNIPHTPTKSIDCPTPGTSKDVNDSLSRVSPSHRKYLSSPLFTPKKGQNKTRRRILQSVSVTRQTQLTPKARKLYRTVIDWGNKMSSLGSRCKSLKRRLVMAEKSVKSLDLHDIFENVNTPTYNFILSQVKFQKKKPKGRRFTTDDKVLALSLMKASGKGYRFLAKIFALPSKKTISNFLSKIPLKPGINDHLFSNLKKSVEEMNEKQKCCVLMFDEMSLSCEVHYNRKEDIIEGIEETTGNDAGIVDHANVFMVQGVYSRWKQPLCFTFSDGPAKSMALKNMIIDVIGKCQEIGLNVVATVCDQGSSNQAAINSLLRDTEDHFKRTGQENRLFGFLVNNKETVPLYDVPHLFKGLRNNLLDKDLYFHYKGKDRIAKWSHIESLYYLNSSGDDQICHKLTDKHVLKASLNKMKVSLCMQVFSHQVGSLLKGIAEWGAPDRSGLEREAVDTGELLLFFDKLFDSLNSNSKVAPSTKPLKGGVSKDSAHEEFWRTAIKVLESMKFFNKTKNCLVKVPSLKNLIHSIKGFIYLKSILLTQFEFKFILTRFFNQDPLENFFSYVRSHGFRNVSPGPTHFISSYKALLINNFMSSHSPFSNCENDGSSSLLLNLKKFIESSDLLLENKHLTENPVELELPRIPPLCNLNKITRCNITYYAGYIAKKIKKMVSKYNCETCKKNLLIWSNNSDIDFIELREYRRNLFLRPGGFLKFLVSQSVPLLNFLIPRLAQNKNISLLLQRMLLENVDFQPINCVVHNLAEKISSFMVKCALFFWCKRINRIARGLDSKFVRFLNKLQDKKSVDPFKLKAYRKWENKRKLLKRCN